MVRGDYSPRTTITHEFGHNLDWAIRQKRFNYFAEDVADVDMASFKIYEQELQDLTEKYTTSDYSLFNSDEAFAEGFAEYECNPNSEYGRVFGAFLKRWL